MSTTTQTRQPTHRIFTVKNSNDKAHWTRIGAAFPNRDDQGFTLIFDAMPIGNRVVMRIVPEGGRP